MIRTDVSSSSFFLFAANKNWFGLKEKKLQIEFSLA